MNRFVHLILAVGASGLLAAPVAAQSPVTSVITYQGELKTAGLPASGTADLRFTLFDAAIAGAQVGPMIERLNLPLVQGRFTEVLDFGAAAFGPQARWLEIAVRSPSGSGNYVTLSPRQAITGAPYALHTRGLNVDESGQVGIGTNSPLGQVHIRQEPLTTGGTLALEGPNGAFMTFFPFDVVAGRRGTVGFMPSSNHLVLTNDSWNGHIALMPGSSANVGIGTTSPTAKLDVRGNIRLGTSGDVLAPGGVENLRIIRGVVGGAGNIIAGSGFTVTHGPTGSGQYTITFNTPFPSPPTIMATAENVSQARTINTAGVTGSTANVRTYFGTSATDAAFHFVAIGPR